MSDIKGFLVALATMVMLALPQGALADRFKLDSSHTYPNFEVSHLGFSIMHGRFNRSDGWLTMDRENGTGSLEVTVYTDSIDTGHEKRDEHLRGEDFFKVAQYPTMRFKSDRVRFIGENEAVVEGRLTMLGVTRPLTLNVDQISCGVHPMNRQYTCGFNAKASLKRSAFGMKAYLPAVGDDISIRIEAEAQKVIEEQRRGGPRNR